MTPDNRIETLLAIMARLRTPLDGCAWDLKQTFATIAPYTIEEAYEVADAIERGDMTDLMDELGDLLLQVVYHARMAEEAGAFQFANVVHSINDKMVRRHPHVFGDADRAPDWETQKKAERAEKDAPKSALDGVALALPALSRAEKLQARAARVGFDWPDTKPVFDKIREETNEVTAAIENGETSERLSEEIGDLLFAVVNLARKLKLDPEAALRKTNSKFQRRFRAIEDRLAAQGKTLEQSSLSEMDALWDAVKGAERLR